MKFIKDILLFEIQTTGPDPEKDLVIQLSALLLDKDNLLEKANFNSYIRTSYLDSLMAKHAAMLGVEYETIKRSQKVFEVIKKFQAKFNSNLLLASHDLNNFLFLRNSFKKAGLVYNYDSHSLHLWTLGYIYTLNYGLRKMPTLNTFFDYFKIKQKNPQDAMEKARLEAEVFRKMVREA